MIHFICGQCQKSYEVSDGLGGSQVRCKQCGAEFIVPLAAAATAVVDRQYRLLASDPSVPPPLAPAGSAGSGVMAVPPRHRSNDLTGLWLVFGGVGVLVTILLVMVGAFALVIARGMREPLSNPQVDAAFTPPPSFSPAPPPNDTIPRIP